MKTFKQYFKEARAKDLKPGDKIKNVNGDCEHAYSEGEVEDVIKLPHKGDKQVKNGNNMPGRLVKYKVTNNGKNYQEGDHLYKTADQLDKKSK